MATLAVQKLYQRYPEPRSRKDRELVEECLEAFKRFDFQKALQVAQRGI